MANISELLSQIMRIGREAGIAGLNRALMDSENSLHQYLKAIKLKAAHVAFFLPTGDGTSPTGFIRLSHRTLNDNSIDTTDGLYIPWLRYPEGQPPYIFPESERLTLENQFLNGYQTTSRTYHALSQDLGQIKLIEEDQIYKEVLVYRACETLANDKPLSLAMEQSLREDIGYSYNPNLLESISRSILRDDQLIRGHLNKQEAISVSDHPIQVMDIFLPLLDYIEKHLSPAERTYLVTNFRHRVAVATHNRLRHKNIMMFSVAHPSLQASFFSRKYLGVFMATFEDTNLAFHVCVQQIAAIFSLLGLFVMNNYLFSKVDQEQLDELNAHIANIRHIVHNPLGNISATLLRHCSKCATNKNQELLAYVNEAYRWLETRKHIGKPQLFPFDELIRELDNDARWIGKVILRLSESSQPLNLFGKRFMLKLALEQFIQNSMEASVGKLAIVEFTSLAAISNGNFPVSGASSWIKIIVDDNGPGIDWSQMTEDSIFNSDTTTKVGGFRGNGLPMAHNLVKMFFQGEILAERSPNHYGGARFIIQIPTFI